MRCIRLCRPFLSVRGPLVFPVMISPYRVFNPTVARTLIMWVVVKRVCTSSFQGTRGWTGSRFCPIEPIRFNWFMLALCLHQLQRNETLVERTTLPGPFATTGWRCRYNSRQHRCPHPGCGREFDRPSKLAAHKKTHEARFVCEFDSCGKAFVLASGFNLHLKEEHPFR